ncbi:MAG: RnfABCDGE type electron transport complex subunit D [Spirochaetota bacterium]
MAQKIFQKQVIMRRVLYSLAPIFLFSIYLYGWRPIAVVAVTFVLGILTEYIVEKRKNKKVSEAVLVTCAIYSLAMPPAVPLWIVAVGIVFAVFIGKEVYGGFGRNIFNPAITGRLFIYITFATVMATSWMAPGAFGTAGEAGVDALSAATPLTAMRNGEMPSWLDLLIGTRAGSIGESSTILIVAAAIYLIWTNTAQWRLVVSTALSAGILTTIFYFTGLAPNLPPHLAMMSGSILYVSVFMSTDPVSAPNQKNSQWVYGALIGTVTILVRTFSGFPEGTSFGIIMGNVFAGLIDELMPKPKKKKTASKPAPKKKDEGAAAAKEAPA